MKNNSIQKTMILCLCLTILITSFTSCAKPVTTETISGYLIDVHCLVKKPDPSADSKTCLNMPACAATGYGIAILQGDKTYKFYFFDGNFAPTATDTQTLAAAIAANTTKTDHLYIEVTGTLTGATKKYLDKDYPVMKVSSIIESTEK